MSGCEGGKGGIDILHKFFLLTLVQERSGSGSSHMSLEHSRVVSGGSNSSLNGSIGGVEMMTLSRLNSSSSRSASSVGTHLREGICVGGMTGANHTNGSGCGGAASAGVGGASAGGLYVSKTNSHHHHLTKNKKKATKKSVVFGSSTSNMTVAVRRHVDAHSHVASGLSSAASHGNLGLLARMEEG